MEVSYQYVKLRRDFGRHPNFRDGPTEVFVDLRPDEELAARWTPVRTTSRGVQAVPTVVGHEVATPARQTSSTFVDATHGCWPKDVDPRDSQQVSRYRKKVERDEDYTKCITRLGAILEEAIKENNALEIYDDYFVNVPDLPDQQPPQMFPLAVLSAPEGAGATLRLCWRPDTTVTGLASLHSSCIAIWDLDAGPPRIERTLAPTASEFSAAAFSPRDSSLLAAAEGTGQLLLLDTRRSAPIAAAGPPGRSRLVDLAWVQSKTGTEIMAATAEGKVEWWDTRALGSGPLDSLDLLLPTDARGSGCNTGQGSSTLPTLIPTLLEYNSASGPTRFLAGTVRGAVLSGNRKAKSAADRISAAFIGHHGPITSLQRHPSFPKYFLSAGDWTVRVWSDDVGHTLLQSPYDRTAYITGAAWSPHRPALSFFLTSTGTLAAWDWTQSTSAPVAELSLSRGSLTGIAFPPGNVYPTLLAAGDSIGNCHLVKLSAGLAHPAVSEKAAMSTILERANNREKYLEKAAREAKLRGRKGGESSSHDPLGDFPAELTPAQEAEVEAKYLAAIKLSGEEETSASPSRSTTTSRG